MQDQKKTIRTGILTTIVALVFFNPAQAYALPNPFFIAVISDIMLQLLIMTALSIPLALISVRRRYFRILPRRLWRYLAALLLLGVISMVFSEIGLHMGSEEIMGADPLEARLEKCRPLSAEMAGKLQLPAGAFLLDPRHPLAFQSYHLMGACNFSLDEVLRLPSVRNKLRGDGRSLVLTLEDFELFPSELFQGSPVLALSSNDTGLPDMSGVTWDKVKDGTLRYYKGGTRKGVGTGKAPDAVVNFKGDAVSMNIGPLWIMGKYISVAGNDADWRLLRPAVIRQMLEAGKWVVDLRHSRLENVRGNIIRMRHYMADIKLLDRLAGSEVREALFVCNSNSTCLAGEILASGIKERGGSVIGYVQFQPDSTDLNDPAFGYPRYIDPHTSTLLAWLILAGAVLLSPLLASAARRGLMLADSRMKNTRIFYRARIFAGLTPLLLLFAILPVSAEFSSTDIGRGWLNLLLFDMHRSGLPFLGGAYTLIFIGLIMIMEKDLGRASRILRGLLLLLFLVPLSLPGPGMIPLTFSIYEIVLIIAAIYSQSAAEWLLHLRKKSEIRRGLNRSGLFSLSNAACADYCGAKIAWLAEALKDGLPIPYSIVLLTKAGAADWEKPLQRTRAMLGAGPYVVRSSAPAEDAAGDITPGRYHSEHDVEPRHLVAAVGAVLDDYVRKGVTPDAAVAVLIQRQMKGRTAGVAMREAAERGSGILVEYGEACNFEITAGTGCSRTARIGGIYRNWLSRIHERSLPPAALFNDLFERLANRFGAGLEIEWTYGRGFLTLLQARHAPVENGTPEHPAAELLKLLRKRLLSLALRPHTAVLDSGQLGDLPPQVSTATFELLRDIWRNDQARLKAFGTSIGRLHPQAIEPAAVRLYGRAYFNLIPANPRLAMLKSPALRALKLLMPLLIRRRISLLSDKLRQLEDSAKIPAQRLESLTPDAAARRLLETRNELLQGSGMISAATALLMSSGLKRKDLQRLEEYDPFLLALAAGQAVETLAANFPLRAMHDLLLEEPRLSEIHVVRTRRMGLTVIDMDGDTLHKLAALRGRARQIMAADAARLRLDYLALGRVLQTDNIFETPIEVIESLAAGMMEHRAAPLEACKEEDSGSLPSSLNLKHLEILAAENHLDSATEKTAGKAVMIGKSSVGAAVAFIPRKGGLDFRPAQHTGRLPVALLLNAPDIEIIAAMPADWLLICTGGSALCHAALLARKRSIRAVFNAAVAIDRISDGDMISIDTRGRINILNPAPAND